MKRLDLLLDWVKTVVRGGATFLARRLNSLTGGRLHPNTITLVGLIMHVPIAYLTATAQLRWAALLLVIFGLFDALDGALARVQNRTSSAGMFLDSTVDRMKEVILYIGVAYYFVNSGYVFWSVWAVAVVGCSLLVSYANAWGEVAITNHSLNQHEINQSFRDGLMRFEVRICMLFIGLMFHQLIITTVLVAVLSFYTAVQRVVLINRHLK